MKILGKEFTFNGFKVYHAGDKPTPSDIGTYSKTEIDDLILDAQGVKVYVSDTEPTGTITEGSLWL